MIEPYTIKATSNAKNIVKGKTWTRDTIQAALRLARSVTQLGADAEVYENGVLIRKLDKIVCACDCACSI